MVGSFKRMLLIEKSAGLIKTLISQVKDEELVTAYLETQESKYFDVLYDRYIHKVLAKCIGILKDQAMAEDAAQDIFIKILLNLSKFKGNSKFSTWIYSITYNFCIDFVRKRKKENVLYDSDKAYEDRSDDEVEDRELMEIRIERLEKLMDSCSDLDKMVLMMKYMDDMSIRNMALVLKKSESATKMSIMRAKQRLNKKYKETYTNG